MVDLSLTIVIQCINFAILLWLLKKVLFGPMTRLLDKRSTDVKQLKEDAERDRVKAGRNVSEAEGRLTSARKESLDMVSSSRQEGFKQREKIIERAKAEADGVMQKARNEMEREANQAKGELRRSTVSISLQIAEKVIRKKLDNDDQKKLAERFLNEMERKR